MGEARKDRHGRARGKDRANGILRRFLGILSAIAAALTQSGCLALDPTDHDRPELANISPSNVVAKSSPAVFVNTFARFCEDGARAPSAFAAQLRAAGYVEVPMPRASRFRHFAVDDSRPAVAFSARTGGFVCAVSAVARTGQFDRVTRHVAKRFPDARPVDAARIAAGGERGWVLDGGGTLLLALRDRVPAGRATYSLVLWRGAPRVAAVSRLERGGGRA